MQDKPTYNLGAFRDLIGVSIYTKGPCALDDVTLMTSRPGTCALIGDEEFTIKRFILATRPFSNEPAKPLVEIEHNGMPKKFKSARLSLKTLAGLFDSRQVAGFSDLIIECTAKSLGFVEQKTTQTPSAPQEGWGRWA